MKFTKFGKALLVSALSAGVILCVTSCVRSYTVGYLYVTGTVTAQSSGNGIISGYKIDHNTGFLTPINGMPVSSGGANPGRAVLLSGSRFLYVLNQGVNAQGGATCTTANPCQNSNITQFAVGGNGIVTPQQTFYTQGINPIRMTPDSSGNFLLVLDHDAPDNSTCKLALGSSATTCGDITVFQINQTTGRLNLVVNAPVTAANGSALTYFPVPANPIDFVLSGGYVLTLSGTSGTGDSVFPYSYGSSTGQLTLAQNSSQPLGITQGTAIVPAGNAIYVLDNEPLKITSTGGTFNAGTYPSQILPFSVGANGALQAEPGGAVPNDPTLANPVYLMLESKGKFLYVANQGNNVLGNNANSGITGYNIFSTPNYQLSFLTQSAFGTGSGPQCLVEDPSNQFIYTANYVDSTITGRAVDPNDGFLNPLRVASSYTLQGPANWCLINGRTD
ncbi:MAG TPA: beta-propeller fold lactonase family protein [Terracidiphilus sp.]|nr:beta-propeller fold lactonase family protein [Terracidiphilus sp.]